MEPKYIVAICALSLFLILFLVFFVLLARRRKMEANLQAWLREMYSDKNMVKIDYDSAEDEGQVNVTERSSAKPSESDSAKTEQDDVFEEVKPKEDDVYEKLEIEGIEEITGNYTPD